MKVQGTGGVGNENAMNNRTVEYELDLGNLPTSGIGKEQSDGIYC
jgi:hypothetical protein